MMNTDTQACWCLKRPFWLVGKVTVYLTLLRGEALFSTSNDHSDLIVNVGDLSVQHLGTVYAVRRYENGTARITVKEGAIRASAPHMKTTDAQASQVMLSNYLDPRVSPQIKTYSAAEIENQLSWQKGLLILNDATLQAAVDEIARYHSTDIIVDPSIRDRRVGVIVDVTNLCAFVDNMRTLHPDIQADVDDAGSKSPLLHFHLQSGHKHNTAPRDTQVKCDLP
jgi:transmembrane sensor